TRGSNVQETGVTDLQAMVDYLAEVGGEGIVPDFGQRAIGVQLDKPVYEPGDTANVALSSLIMTGVDDIVDSEITLSVAGGDSVTVPVDTTVGDEIADEAGRANAELVVPADASPGSPVLVTVSGEATGTEA